jgi:epoxyqueuosine reductase
MGRVDRDLTRAVEAEARRLGADLVGFAPYSRWDKAPIDRSPSGVFPSGRTAIVCAVHFLDATTERGGEPDPRIPDSAMAEMDASSVLQDVGYQLSRFLERMGHKTLFIPQSLYWRYRGKGDGDLRGNGDRGWAGDVCSYYAAVCAGLGEIGWNNLCLTPQYGPRQRLVTVMTEAQLAPTPLYRGSALCDRCLLCARHCPTQCFDLDRSGEMRSIQIEDRRFEFPDRNLWRCAIGENFQLDVFLDQWKGKSIDEKLITQMQAEAVDSHHEWVYGWKMGMCLKHCMPPQRRYFDRTFSQGPRRRRDVKTDYSASKVRAMLAKLESRAAGLGVDFLASAPLEVFEQAGLEPKRKLPTARGAVVFGIGYPDGCALTTSRRGARARLAFGVIAQETYGFDALVTADLPNERYAVAAGLAKESEGLPVAQPYGNRVAWSVLLTDAPVPPWKGTPTRAPVPVAGGVRGLTAAVRRWASKSGADLVGIAPANRLCDAQSSMRSWPGAGFETAVVEDKGWDITGRGVWGGQAWPYNLELKKVTLEPKSPTDYLPSARSVIVVGVKLLDAPIDGAGKPPAFKAGNYMIAVHGEAVDHLNDILLTLVRELTLRGFRAVATSDLEAQASRVNESVPDLLASRFAAVAAGLGEVGWNGILLTPQYGPRQRVACLVTDAKLEPDAVYSGPSLCRRCKACVEACPVLAIERELSCSVSIGGRTFEWGQTDRVRCDCAKRYGLVAAAGPKYIGCTTDVKLPDTITPEWLVETIRNRDRLQRPGSYLTIVERCFTECPSGSALGER